MNAYSIDSRNKPWETQIITNTIPLIQQQRKKNTLKCLGKTSGFNNEK